MNQFGLKKGQPRAFSTTFTDMDRSFGLRGLLDQRS